MGRCLYIFYLLLLLALDYAASSASAALKTNTTQARILNDLFEIFESGFGVPSASLRNGGDGNQCDWTGVTCVSGGSGEVVKKLSFSNLGISSTNSSAVDGLLNVICSLDTLQYLDLSGNSFGSLGSFTNCTGLTGLKYLNFSNNKLAGEIPDLSNFRQLEVLDLSLNDLNGIVGTKLDSLTRLQSLNLSHNYFSGSIPSIFSNMSYLVVLDLSYNNFSGPVSDSLTNLPFLTFLDLSNNNLSGTLPLDSLTRLQSLNLSHNYFSGSIPSIFSNMSYLVVLDLSYNNFSGPVSDSLTNLPFLTFLDLSNNNLSGTLPTFQGQVDVIYSGNAFLSIPNFNDVTESNTATLVALIVCFASGMIASFSLASIIFNCCYKPEVTEAEHGHTGRITSPSVETPSLDRYLEMVQRWEYRARMNGPRQQRRRMLPLYG